MNTKHVLLVKQEFDKHIKLSGAVTYDHLFETCFRDTGYMDSFEQMEILDYLVREKMMDELSPEGT